MTERTSKGRKDSNVDGGGSPKTGNAARRVGTRRSDAGHGAKNSTPGDAPPHKVGAKPSAKPASNSPDGPPRGASSPSPAAAAGQALTPAADAKMGAATTWRTRSGFQAGAFRPAGPPDGVAVPDTAEEAVSMLRSLVRRAQTEGVTATAVAAGRAFLAELQQAADAPGSGQDVREGHVLARAAALFAVSASPRVLATAHGMVAKGARAERNAGGDAHPMVAEAKQALREAKRRHRAAGRRLDLEVTFTVQTGASRPEHARIVALGCGDRTYPIGQVVAWIEEGRYGFYVRDRETGRPTRVVTCRCGKGKPHVRTQGNKTTADNLDSLPMLRRDA